MKEIAKIKDHKLIAVKLKKIGNISNTMKMILTSSISASFLIISTEFFVYNQ